MNHPMPPGDPLPRDPAPSGVSWESRMLMEHAELAMRLCRQVAKQAEDANWVGMGGDTMFARFSHAMHVSIALKARLEAQAGRRARRAGIALPPEAEEREPDQRPAAVRSVVGTAVEADPADNARLRLDLGVRLDHLDIMREIEGRSFGEVLSEVRGELGLPGEGFDVPTDAASLTRLAALGTLSREAGEGKAGAVGAGAVADDAAAADDGWPDDAVLQAVIRRPPCSLWSTAADIEEERLASGHDPP